MFEPTEEEFWNPTELDLLVCNYREDIEKSIKESGFDMIESKKTMNN